MRLKSITVQGFRGFNDNQTINLDNNIVLVYGLNGTGKSGFAEALEWLFYDEISRRTRSQCKSEFTSDSIKNIHYDKEESPFVELTIIVSGKEVVLKKEFISVTNCKFYIDTAEVPSFSSLGVSLDEIHKPILGQSEIKRFVDTEQKDRWEEISRILGLEKLSNIRDHLLHVKNEFDNDQRFQELNKLRNSIEYDLNHVGSLDEYIELIRTPFDNKTFDVELISNLAKTLSHKGNNLNDFKKLLEDRVNLILNISSISETLRKLNYEQNKELEGHMAELIKRAQTLINELHTLNNFKFTEAAFIQKGLDLVEKDLCPFCGEKTLTDAKKKHITKCLEEHTQNLKKYELFIQLKDGIRKEQANFITNISKTLITPKELRIVIDDLSKRSEYKDIVIKLDDFLNTKHKDFFENINNYSTSFDGFVKLLSDLPNDEENLNKCKSFESSLKNNLNEIIAQSIKNGMILNNFKEELTLKTQGLSDDDKKSLNMIQGLLKVIDNRNKLNILRVYSKNIEKVKNLIRHVEEFEKQKAEDLLKNLSSSIKSYYGELNPDEKITFEEIIPSVGKSRRAKLKGKSFGKDINPISCFSEAHSNCLGLSLYFPQRVDNNPDWGFILLDDPVQSMDINHSKNLIRILKRLSSNKQIIVLSHSHSFKQDFDDIFYGVDFLSYDFSDYKQQGPKITLMKGSIDNCLDFAKKLARGTLTERHTAGTTVRKALENFTAELLIQKGGVGISKASKLKQEERIVKIEELGLCTTDDIGEIKALLNILDPVSHGRPRRDASDAEILDGIKIVGGLKKTCLN
jgi:hypothetical protein